MEGWKSRWRRRWGCLGTRRLGIGKVCGCHGDEAVKLPEGFEVVARSRQGWWRRGESGEEVLWPAISS
ncbi:UNVERIFIED_CONTAM: hypothetical protein Slati_4322000 [Sesamum latifolium]|uniref:Uncharacterized protein n=1 Tax=Sesamum latifolium TaxID=2727402 RepID=A0AAW2SP74_9LAMI